MARAPRPCKDQVGTQGPPNDVANMISTIPSKLVECQHCANHRTRFNLRPKQPSVQQAKLDDTAAIESFVGIFVGDPVLWRANLKALFWSAKRKGLAELWEFYCSTRRGHESQTHVLVATGRRDWRPFLP